MTEGRTWKKGERVRVRRDFPHTLPHFAQVHEGVVEGTTELGSIIVKFDDERSFPFAPEWLEPVE